MNELRDIESTYGCEIYPRRDIQLVRGENANVWDSNGRKYIDCIGGHGVASVGHCNPAVVEAVSRQARNLITCPGTFYNDARARFLEKLFSVVPGNLKQAFLCNSGAEANEAALKFARFTTGRTEFVCALRGFHGRTMGALSATFTPKYREPFNPLVPGFSFVPYNNIEKLEQKITENTAGVLLEVVQGEGGVHVGEGDYFSEVQRLCRERGALLIIDEVQTGFCRTGRLFGVDHFGLEPDLMTVAKAMAGGMPMGGLLCSENVTIPKGNHGSTFGGNPLACAAGEAAIDYMMDNDLADQAEAKGRYLKEKLTALNLEKVKEIRGLGLLVGIDLRERVSPYLAALAEAGVLALPAGRNVLRLLPPLTIGFDQLDTVVDTIADCL